MSMGHKEMFRPVDDKKKKMAESVFFLYYYFTNIDQLEKFYCNKK